MYDIYIGAVMKRRELFKSMFKVASSVVVSGTALSLIVNQFRRDKFKTKAEGEPTVLRPPGALDEEAFLSKCIRCQECTQACPKNCIKLSGSMDETEFGTPFINPRLNACDLCLKCTEVCPTGALQKVEKKEDVKMGLAVVNELTCVSHNGTGACGACHTICPLKNKALTQGMFNRPTIHSDYCVGCGLCEEVCILDGVKAIRVFSNRDV